MTDPGFVYLVVKVVIVSGMRHILHCANNLTMCKVGKSLRPPDRLAKAEGEASTWHPEEFQLLYMKYVPSMKFAEGKIHEFFKETNVTPAYLKGGREWFLSDPNRVRCVMEALEGDPIRESADEPVRPPPVKRCEVCEVSCRTAKEYARHCEGKLHKFRTDPATRPNLACAACKITCTSQRKYEAHLETAKHLKKTTSVCVVE